MKIFRIEERNGIHGPFHFRELISLLYDNTVSIPLMMEDYAWGREGLFWEEYHCGCDSLELLRKWFNVPRFVELAKKRKLVIKELKVSKKRVKVGRSGTQVFFQRKDIHHEVIHSLNLLTNT